MAKIHSEVMYNVIYGNYYPREYAEGYGTISSKAEAEQIADELNKIDDTTMWRVEEVT